MRSQIRSLSRACALSACAARVLVERLHITAEGQPAVSPRLTLQGDERGRSATEASSPAAAPETAIHRTAADRPVTRRRRRRSTRR